MSRRRKGPKVVRVAVMFLGVVALVGTMTTLAGAVPSVVAKSARPSSGSVASIDHVVVLMQENRSYDSYFSRLHFQGQPQASVESRSRTRTRSVGPPSIRSSRRARAPPPTSTTGGTRRTSRSPAVGWTASPPRTWTRPIQRAAGRWATTTRRTLPFYYGIANEFSVADRYFASVPGPTFPNRFYLLTGTSFGYTSNVTQIYTQKTIFQSLDEAPTPVSWKIYLASFQVEQLFKYVAGPRRWSCVSDLAVLH